MPIEKDQSCIQSEIEHLNKKLKHVHSDESKKKVMTELAILKERLRQSQIPTEKSGQ
ncbi:hypothetical protein [Bacillus sp. FJAT-45037]|uniref:hypothetical protein n=1 Tax=Bacillus sp. FJAT-45037 TaxID=2011007 RepID=UPI0012FD3092|nr:hypothetical protein [Bacillus sp. FJAT-45037]